MRARRGRGRRADPRPGHDRDHRDSARRHRHRRRSDHRARPRRADDRAQLRDRPARDGRARQMARRELAGADLGSAQCRPARAERRAQWLERFILEDGVNLIGGCCGTGVAHIAALDRMLRRLGRDRPRPRPKRRRPAWVPAIASLYSQVALRQESAYLSIGERCNANGSRQFRRLQEQGDWEGCVEIGRAQVKEGSHALDLCTAFVGRDEVADMSAVVRRMRGAVNAPLVIDSTEYPVLEAALELYGGKPIINSINFEDGEAAAAQRLALARRFGAAVIALTIDEAGMAKEAARKFAIARRLHDFACGRYGLPPADLLLDP